MRITVVAGKIEDIAYAYTILFGGGEWRGQTSIINDTKAPCRGALLGTIKDAFTPRVLFNAFLFLVCPFWSEAGYDFRGNYGSG